MLVTRIGRLEQDRCRARLEDDVHDPLERNVVIVRTLVIAQQTCIRIASGGMLAVAALSASTLASATLRNSSSLTSWYPVCRDIARSGQSS
jgi:hypothetical protein